MKRVIKGFLRVLFILLIVLPVLAGLIYSILFSVGIISWTNDGFTLEFWSAVLSDTEFWSSLAFSVFISLVSIGGSSLLAMFMSYKLSKHKPRPTLQFLTYLPLTLPPIVLAFLIFVLFSRSGLFSRLAYHLSFIHSTDNFPVLLNDGYGIGIILALFVPSFAFFLLWFSQQYQNHEIHKLENIASSLGLPIRSIFRYVVLPAFMKLSSTPILLYGLFAVGVYEVPLLLGRQNPQMLSILTVNKLQRFDLSDMPQAYVLTTLYTLMICVPLLIFMVGKRQQYG